MNDIELLQYVHETAEMGIQGLSSLDGQVRSWGSHTELLYLISPGRSTAFPGKAGHTRGEVIQT